MVMGGGVTMVVNLAVTVHGLVTVAVEVVLLKEVGIFLTDFAPDSVVHFVFAASVMPMAATEANAIVRMSSFILPARTGDGNNGSHGDVGADAHQDMYER